MKRTIILFILVISQINSTIAQDKRFFEPLSARTSNYDIKVFLDTEKKQVKASQTLVFNNPSADTIWTMPFHMYYNAFKNNLTTFNGGFLKIPLETENGLFGWVEVTSVMDGEDELKFSFVQPDNDNLNDHTVLEVQLKTPVLPNSSKTLEMEWHSQIPKFKPRTGYSRDFFFMVQWYPKLGVYEPAGSRFAKEGAWNCHQYHPQTEYFGEFGVYQVEVDVPSDYKTGGSGFLLKIEENGERKKVTYLAEDVIDFAWTAHPGFIEIVDNWKGVDIKLLIMPEHVCNKERFLNAAKNTLDFYEEYIEKYPYPVLTIVSPPYHGLFSGAMEYPTLITAPTLCDLPEGIKVTETLTIHELTHQYFMQMIGTNEQEEPWMDEGFTSFFEAKILDKYYPEGVVNFDYFDIKVMSKELRRGRFMSTNNPKVYPISKFGFTTRDKSNRDIVYGKAAVGLMTLEGLVGDETMQQIIHAYFQRWKFKHPCRHDFLDVVDEVVQKEQGDSIALIVNDFMQQFIYGTDECDYAVSEIVNDDIPEPVGFFDDVNNYQAGGEQWENIVRSKAILYRLGELIVPQDVKITFSDGEEIIEKWDGKERRFEFVYKGKREIECVEIDPALKNPLDKNLINNSYTLQPKKTGIRRYFVSFLTWMEGAMVTASSLI
ncbi:MAG: hypothetical protein ACI94Y_002157 [Maribacter sp.]|jgi:hypothetical protein